MSPASSRCLFSAHQLMNELTNHSDTAKTEKYPMIFAEDNPAICLCAIFASKTQFSTTELQYLQTRFLVVFGLRLSLNVRGVEH